MNNQRVLSSNLCRRHRRPRGHAHPLTGPPRPLIDRVRMRSERRGKLDRDDADAVQPVLLLALEGVMGLVRVGNGTLVETVGPDLQTEHGLRVGTRAWQPLLDVRLA